MHVSPKMWKCFSIVLLVTVISQAQNETEPVESFLSATSSSVESTGKNTSIPEDSPKEKLQVDTEHAPICQACSCQEEIPLLIDCSNKGLKAAFLFSDWPTDGAMEARFDGNEFEEITQFPNLPLVKLTYRKNSIKLIQKAAFKFLKSLEFLDLSENSLTHESLGGNVFEGQFSEDDYEPLQLKVLDLGYNQIHSIDKDAFNHLATHLETLKLNNNPLSVIDHQTAIAITTLRKLKVLNLAETKLNSIPEGLFHALPSLKYLILSGNRFVQVPEELQRAVNLEYLNLNDNPIKTLGAQSFIGLTSLKGLNISSMSNLESIGINTFTPLQSMIHLWCSFNPVLRRFHQGAFNNMATSDGTLKLQEFHFRGNHVPTLSSKLLPWDSLQLVDIEGNSFMCDCRIGWIVTNLLPSLAEKRPDETITLTCSGPEGYEGRSLVDLGDDKDIISNCTLLADSYDDDNENSDGAGYPFGRRPTMVASSFNVGLMVISLFGIALVIGGIACMGLMAVRKSHLRQVYDSTSGSIVHYVRTPGGAGKMEDEQAIVAREVSQYDEEP